MGKRPASSVVVAVNPVGKGKISTINVGEGIYKNAESKPVSTFNLLEEKEVKIEDSKEEEYEDPFRQPILSHINLTPLPEASDG